MVPKILVIPNAPSQKKQCLRGVKRHPFFILFPKKWPNYGQNWDIKEKRFCIFAHFELLAKSLWRPEPEAMSTL